MTKTGMRQNITICSEVNHASATIHVHVITTLELSCSSGWMYIVYAYLLALPPYLAYTTVDLNPANWVASVAQLAEHWISNLVVMGLNHVRSSSVFFFTVCLRTLPYLLSLVLMHIHVQD